MLDQVRLVTELAYPWSERVDEQAPDGTGGPLLWAPRRLIRLDPGFERTV